MNIKYHYFPAGPVERPCKDRQGRASYRWASGYAMVFSSGYASSAWVTRREAQRESRNNGGKAVFHKSEEEARHAVLDERHP